MVAAEELQIDDRVKAVLDAEAAAAAQGDANRQGVDQVLACKFVTARL